MNCPHCGKPIPAKLLASEGARKMASKRTTFGGGRPRSRKQRCACGEMTLKRAEARGHKCG